MFTIFILCAVLLLISIRQIGKFRLEIWQIMLGGAAAVLLAGEITPSEAIKAVDFDVIFFLFGMFVCGALFEISGYLAYNQYRLFRNVDTAEKALFIFVFFCGISSAVVMNDTVAVIGVPVAVNLSKRFGISTKPLILALAFSITIGSVFSPIGNPQNLLIAISGSMSNPFLSFLKYLFLPTILNLLLLFLAIRAVYKNDFSAAALKHFYVPEKKKWLYFLSNLTMAIILASIAAKIYFSLHGQQLRLTWIAVFACMPALLLSFQQVKILKNTDWKTLVFFAAMFVLMRAVWNCGFFQSLIEKGGFNILSIPFIFISALILSQFVSNVPLVALFLPLLSLKGGGDTQLLSLAAASTLAGNLSILGAASNVIVIQNVENRTGETITFSEFVRMGVPLTAVNCFLCWLFLR
ncbi:MAG: SLC13 family permease [Elusimicrobiota bacterium]